MNTQHTLETPRSMRTQFAARTARRVRVAGKWVDIQQALRSLSKSDIAKAMAKLYGWPIVEITANPVLPADFAGVPDRFPRNVHTMSAEQGLEFLGL